MNFKIIMLHERRQTKKEEYIIIMDASIYLNS